MPVMSRIRDRIFDARYGGLDRDAMVLFRDARASFGRGLPDQGLGLMAQAVALDDRVFCLNWGLPLPPQTPAPQIVRRLMQRRLQEWYIGEGPKTAPPVARLADKVALRRWADPRGNIRLPRQIGQFPDLHTVPWADLIGQNLVIKPRHAEMARGVLVIDGGQDVMRQATTGPDLAAYAAAVWHREEVGDGPVLIEELVTDTQSAHDPQTRIPRDFKGLCAMGRVAFVTVQDTNAPGGYQSFRARRSFDAAGRVLPAPHATVHDFGPHAKPQGFDAVIAAMRALSAEFPEPVRFDFFVDSEGPVLGEITTYPNAGLNYSTFAARTFLQMLALTGEARLPL